ncbi:hypothetical protein CRUP_008365 [Coryphaenoides rupestris]|nr:hypothetical protein CRUP_008365 [Coryphaenoides rupestris]
MVASTMSSFVKWTIILLVLVSVILNVVLICLGSNKAPKCTRTPRHPPAAKHDARSTVFADLTPEEYTQVRDYLLGLTELDVTSNAFAKPSQNFLFLIDLLLPKKAQALSYLENKGAKPAREATAVIFHGARGYIREYVVGPLPNPTYCRDVTVDRYGADLPINARTVTVGEYVLLFQLVEEKVFAKLSKLMKESFDVDKDKTVNAFEQMPRGVKSGDRVTWISFFRDMSGMYIHPVGLEILVNHGSTNASSWRVERLLYNGQYFDTVEDLKTQYDAGNVTKIVYKKTDDYGSLKPRRTPLQVAPQHFAFGLSSLTGMRAFDVRFRGERIVYELSVQEAMSVYGSATPGLALTKFLDSSIGVGRFAHELVRGVDCPYDATYVTTHRYIDAPGPTRYKNSICVFEHNTGQPLRRHFADFYSNSYGGMVNSALVLRTITAIGNYDYMWDFIFYQTGAVEAKVHATGYMSTSYLVDGNMKYGHQVADKVLGNIHTHFVNFKVDLDVVGCTSGVLELSPGVKNVFLTKDMKYVNVSMPWNPQHYAMIPHLVEKQLGTEQEAALRYGNQDPPLPPRRQYKVAITKHKDTEQTSSSLYSQNDMWSPAVDFSKYIKDNESIENEDLVAWVTTGFLHIPHAEDVPNTVTVGNGGGVILRPHNYFDTDPSIDSPDSVYINPGTEQSCDTNRMACLAQETCSPVLEPFTFNGFDGVINFDGF